MLFPVNVYGHLYVPSRLSLLVYLDLTAWQVGHDNWIRALVFHPTGKYLLSASDDKTIKVWDLMNGRCTKTIEAHSHFVTCMTWGRALVGGGGNAGGGSAEGTGGAGNKGMVNGGGDEKSAGKEARRIINVLATGSVDQTIKVGRFRKTPLLNEGFRLTTRDDPQSQVWTP